LVDKIVERAAELEHLEKAGAGRSGISQSVLTNGLVAPARKIVRDWMSVQAPA
jgi:hypothetical protein